MKRYKLSVFRSDKHLYGQIIDNEKSKTLISLSDLSDLGDLGGKTSKTDKALLVGKLLAKIALEKKIEKIVFDRGRFRYHGRVKALAEGAREGGLKF